MKYQAFCPFCQSRKMIYKKKHINLTNVILSILSSLALGYLIFLKIDFKSLILSGFFLAFSEIFIHLRWRISLICQECGFDPVLYKENQKLAADKVQKHLEKRSENPINYLKPPLKIPIKLVTPKKDIKIIRNGNSELKKYQLFSLHSKQKENSQQQGEQKSKQSQPMILT